MPRYLALFIGAASDEQKSEGLPEEESARFMDAWAKWAEKHQTAIVDHGAPLGPTKRADAAGITDTKNMLVAYAIVEAASHQDAARIFEENPHITLPETPSRFWSASRCRKPERRSLLPRRAPPDVAAEKSVRPVDLRRPPRRPASAPRAIVAAARRDVEHAPAVRDDPPTAAPRCRPGTP